MLPQIKLWSAAACLKNRLPYSSLLHFNGRSGLLVTVHPLSLLAILVFTSHLLS